MSNDTLQKLYPERLREFVSQYPHEDLRTIVIAKRERLLQAEKLITSVASFSDVGEAGAEILNIIDAFAVTTTSGLLPMLARWDAIDSIWYIHPGIYDMYVRLIKSIENSIKEPGTLAINVSLAPPSELLPMPYIPEEPIHRATKIAADHKKLIVFAAGNGGPFEDSLSPWGLAPWVLSIGAASQDGKTLASFSGRGRSGDPIYRPTVVAPGIDIKVPLDSFDFYTPPENLTEREYSIGQHGTSWATALVSRIVVQIGYFLEAMREDLLMKQKSKRKIHDERPLTFAQIYTHKQEGRRDDRVTNFRLAGSIIDDHVFSYPVDPSPLVIKQMIMDMAIPMQSYESHEVGAGFVSPALAEYCFGTFGAINSEEMGTISYHVPAWGNDDDE